MGNDNHKPNNKGSVPVYNKVIDKSKLDIQIKQIYFTAQLNKDRRRGQCNQREKELLNLIREPVQKRNRDNEYQKASAIVNDLKWVKAHECIMRYADIIKDNEMVIAMSKGDPRKVNDLLPYVESLLWGCQKVNIDCVKAFGEFIISTFGADVYSELSKNQQVTDDLKKCFDSILPSQKEVKEYLIELCKKNNIKLEVMNEIGHDLSESALADMGGPNDYNNATQITVNIGGNNQGGYPNNQGGYPNNQGGYPNNQGGYPNNQGGYPNNQGGFNNNQGGYGDYLNNMNNNNNNNSNQSGYPSNQGGYPSSGNNSNQGGYPSGGNQGGFGGNQGGYGGNQGGYGGNQGGYGGNSGNQGGYGGSQGGFGGNQGGNGGNSGNQGGFGGNQGGFGGNQGGYGGNSGNPGGFGGNQGASGNPGGFGGNQGNNNSAPKKEESAPKPQDQSQYPMFQKFTVENKGGSGDPLDELDQRFNNIKNGL